MGRIYLCVPVSVCVCEDTRLKVLNRQAMPQGEMIIDAR